MQRFEAIFHVHGQQQAEWNFASTFKYIICIAYSHISFNNGFIIEKKSHVRIKWIHAVLADIVRRCLNYQVSCQ